MQSISYGQKTVSLHNSSEGKNLHLSPRRALILLLFCLTCSGILDLHLHSRTKSLSWHNQFLKSHSTCSTFLLDTFWNQNCCFGLQNSCITSTMILLGNKAVSVSVRVRQCFEYRISIYLLVFPSDALKYGMCSNKYMVVWIYHMGYRVSILILSISEYYFLTTDRSKKIFSIFWYINMVYFN